MTVKLIDSQSVSKPTYTMYFKISWKHTKVFSLLVLLILLIVNVFQSGQAASSDPSIFQAVSTRTFAAIADSYVEELHPNRNNGTQNTLEVENVSKHGLESYIKFKVTGISGVIQSVSLRVYLTTNSVSNGPAVYATSNAWTETGITWNNRPARINGALDNKGSITKSTWVQYNVATRVTSNITYSFILTGDTTDQIGFSSREGNQPPQLVVSYIPNTKTPTPISKTATAKPPSTATKAILTPTQTPWPNATSSTGSVVMVGAGDISICGNNNDEATAKLLDSIAGTVFTLGDNAYSNGSYTQYINCYNPTWGRHITRTKPVPGNHDYEPVGAAGYFQYFNNLPPYYAYNLGAWRIYALNSEIDISATGAQAVWLQTDLAANPHLCVLAYWHRPRWSSGSTHGNSADLQALWQILYNAGAELVLSGHEHNYERFTQMNANGNPVTKGIREIVAGTGGEGHYPFGTILSTSQVHNSSTFGVLKLTLNPSSYSWTFVPVAGATFTDSGTTDCH
jgi:calcineurin-like phosphoesterase family protein